MFYPFLVADPRSGLHYRLTDTSLAELSLAPKAPEWAPGRAIVEDPLPVWRESLANAPVETISAVNAALEGLVLATTDLRVPSSDAMGDSRAKRHLDALIGLWRKLGDALPEGLAAVRHVLELPHGRFLDAVPVVEGSLDPHAPGAMKALYARLHQEFGAVADPSRGARRVKGRDCTPCRAGWPRQQSRPGQKMTASPFMVCAIWLPALILPPPARVP